MKRDHVNSGRSAEASESLADVRFTPKADKVVGASRCPLCAKSRHMQRSKRAPLFGRHSRNETLWNVLLHQSALAPENLITLAHFSVSVTTNLAKSEGEPGNTAAPRSANRAFNLGSTRPALISLLSLLTMSAGVFLGAPMPCSALAS